MVSWMLQRSDSDKLPNYTVQPTTLAGAPRLAYTRAKSVELMFRKILFWIQCQCWTLIEKRYWRQKHRNRLECIFVSLRYYFPTRCKVRSFPHDQDTPGEHCSAGFQNSIVNQDNSRFAWRDHRWPKARAVIHWWERFCSTSGRIFCLPGTERKHRKDGRPSYAAKL